MINMRSERSTSAGTARRTTFRNDGVVKTFFAGWAFTEQGTTAGWCASAARLPSSEYPRASGEGAS